MFHFFHFWIRLLLFQFSHDRQMQNASQELSQKYILPRTTQRRRRRVRRCRWQRFKRIATKILYLHRIMAATANSIQSSYAVRPSPDSRPARHTHTHASASLAYFWTRNFIRWMSRVVSCICTWMIEEHWPYYRKANKRTPVRRLTWKKFICRSISPCCVYIVSSVQFNDDESDDQVKSATLIQHNNMDYEKYCPPMANSDARTVFEFVCAVRQRFTIAVESHWLSLMNENGNLTNLCSSGCGCHTLACGKFQMPRSNKKKTKITQFALHSTPYVLNFRRNLSLGICADLRQNTRTHFVLFEFKLILRACLAEKDLKSKHCRSTCSPNIPKLRENTRNFNDDYFRRYLCGM